MNPVKHPRPASTAVFPKPPLSARDLLKLCLEEGADDAGFVDIGRPGLDGERPGLRKIYPRVQSLISLVQVMNRENLQSPERYPANDEFHHTIHQLTETARRILKRLNKMGVRGVVPTVGFPLDMDRWGEIKIWDVSHKIIAEEAGLGRMGKNRNVIHPRFGNFILLETILIDRAIDLPNQPIDYNPCLTCNLCVAACPVGAISPAGDFDVSACLTHNYREFLGGFQDWVASLVSAKNPEAYSERFGDEETVSMWQSLAFGPNYKSAYCMAVCPAGEEVLPLFQDDRRRYIEEIVAPLKNRVEPVYVKLGSPAEMAARKNPNKHIRPVRTFARPATFTGFLRAVSLAFNPLKAEGLNAVYHFKIEGEPASKATVAVKAGRVNVAKGLRGQADLTIHADEATWIKIVRGELSPVRALLTRRLRLKGPVRLLTALKRFLE